MFDYRRVFKCYHVLRLGLKIIPLQNWFCKVLAPVVTEPQFFTVLVWLWFSISWKAWQNRCGLRAWYGCEACPWRPMEDGWSQTLGAKVLPDGCGESIWPSDRTMFSWESSPDGSSFACYQCTSCNLGLIGYDLAKFSGSIVPSAWNSEQAHTVAWAPVDTWRTWQVVAAFSGEAPNFEDKDKLLAATKPRYCHMWVGSSLQVRILDIDIELHWYIYHWQSYWQSFWTHFCTWNVGRERERERGKDRDGGKVALNGWRI